MNSISKVTLSIKPASAVQMLEFYFLGRSSRTRNKYTVNKNVPRHKPVYLN